MSIAGILSSNLLNLGSHNVASPQPSFQKEFQKLGQDLKSGNVPAAQQDFGNIQKAVPDQSVQTYRHHHHSGGRENTSLGQPSTLAHEFAQLGQDLQAGNVAAAQQAYSTVQQAFQGLTGNGAFSLATAGSSSAAGLQVTA
jgi:hypothetical protein